MSFFRRLFGKDDEVAGEPAPAAEQATAAAPGAPLGDPYRGDLYVEPAARARQPAQKITPIWDSWTRILAVERSGDSGLPLGSLVYDGESGGDFQAVRRVVFVEDGVVVRWEYKLASRDILSNHLVTRVGDRVLIPGAAGLVAVHLETGEPCWELPHPAALYKAPVRHPDGDLLLVFHDQSWLKLGPRDGAFREEGTVRSDAEAQALLDRGVPLLERSETSVRYSGHRVRVRFNELHVEADDDPPAVPSDRYEPPAPSAGSYPIDEWQPDDYVGLVGDKLAVALKRPWGDRTRLAIGLFEPTSLEPLRLVELADINTIGFKRGYVVDDVLLADLQSVPQVPQPLPAQSVRHRLRMGAYTTFVVDTYAERVLACFAEGEPSFLFDDAGRQVWRGEL